jgi:hypothetical protein
MSSSEQKVSHTDLEVGPTELPLAHLTDRELQRTLADAVRAYSGRQQQGARFPAFATDADEPVVTGTDAVVAAAAILEATNVEIFELGLWHAWGTLS